MELLSAILMAHGEHAGAPPPQAAACAAKDLPAILHITNYSFGALALLALVAAKAGLRLLSAS